MPRTSKIAAQSRKSKRLSVSSPQLPWLMTHRGATHQSIRTKLLMESSLWMCRTQPTKAQPSSSNVMTMMTTIQPSNSSSKTKTQRRDKPHLWSLWTRQEKSSLQTRTLVKVANLSQHCRANQIRCNLIRFNKPLSWIQNCKSMKKQLLRYKSHRSRSSSSSRRKSKVWQINKTYASQSIILK